MTGYLCRNTRVARFFVGKEMHMNYEKLSGSIRAVIDRRPGDNGAYSDLFSLCREWETEDFSAAHKVNKELLALSAFQWPAWGKFLRTARFVPQHHVDGPGLGMAVRANGCHNGGVDALHQQLQILIFLHKTSTLSAMWRGPGSRGRAVCVLRTDREDCRRSRR